MNAHHLHGSKIKRHRLIHLRSITDFRIFHFHTYVVWQIWIGFFENLFRFENRHCEGSITNKDRVNVNYESDYLKNESQWEIATSLNVVILLIQENDIHLELSNRFSPRHNDDQNLTTKDQQVQFLIYLRKFQLIVETHLPMQLILCEIKDRLYVPSRIT